MTKIKSLVIRGLRGVRGELKLDLDGHSLLVFGENGSGKSSIADALEWFYEDKIDHLATEEIGRKGLEAMRNIFLDEGDPASVTVEFCNSGAVTARSLFFKKGALKSEYGDGSPELEEYLDQSRKENLILRFRDLADFIQSPKKEKLDTLSEIIGFSEVSKTRDVLRKSLGELSREFKRGNYDDSINLQQQKIIAQLGRNVTSEAQFVEAVDEVIAPLKIDLKMRSIADIEAILAAVKQPEDREILELGSFYNRTADWTIATQTALEEIDKLYREYYRQFNKIAGDIEQLSKILLERLLDEGSRLLRNNSFTDDACPLCLQPQSRKRLQDDIDKRIGQLSSFKKEKEALDGSQASLREELKLPMQKIDSFLQQQHIKHDDNRQLESDLEHLKRSLTLIDQQALKKLSPASKLIDPVEASIDRALLERISSFCKERALALSKQRAGDVKFEIQRKILLTKEAYLTICKLTREKHVLLEQQRSMQAIYSEFVKKQQEALEAFLDRFSSDIDSYYRFMNPGESVSGFRLVPIEKGEELQGITLEYSFYDEIHSPPQKYLSESHLNCLGLAFFLTSVKAFNKQNKFFILDDVISSYDSNHRKRFADLLFEKFSDYQILLLTHERDCFDSIKESVNNDNWLSWEIRWDKEQGIYLD